MTRTTPTIKAQPTWVATWVPARAFVINRGTQTVYFGGPNVTPGTAYAEVPAGSAIDFATRGYAGRDDLHAVTASGTSSIEVTTTSSDFEHAAVIRDAVAAAPGVGNGVPAHLLTGTTLDEVLDSLAAVNAYLGATVANDGATITPRWTA